MEHTIHITGVIGEIPDAKGNIITPNTTFLDLVQQVEAKKDTTQLNVVINSMGGYVEEGTEMYNYLLALKNKGVAVNTYAKEVCASIATKIFAAGSERILLGAPQFMIHNPFGAPNAGDADFIEAYSKALRNTETDLLNFYSEITGTSVEAIKPLMKKETFLTPEQAVNLGFATAIQQDIQVKAMAYFKTNHLKQDNMSKNALTKDEAETLLDKFSNKIKAFFDDKPKAKIVQDATGQDIDFTDLGEDSMPTVGDAATINGSQAEGSVVMPNGETYVFEAGVLTAINAAEDNTESEEMMALKAQVKNLTAEAKTQAEANKALEQENADFKNKFKAFQEEIKDIKSTIGSSFTHQDGANRNQNQNTTKRRVLKS